MVLEKQASVKIQDERNYGVDLLRIVAMLMVVLLHVWGPGGILFEVKSGTAHYQAAWLLEIAVFCAINCYGLISGYVGITSRYKYSNFVALWLQVTCYNVLITLYYYLTQPNVVPFSSVVTAFFPVSNSTFWYFTAYAGLFVLMPVLNRAVNSMTKNQLKGVVIALFVGLCVLPCIFNKDIFLTGWGYSFLWLAYLYITGAYIKKYGFFQNKTWIAVLIYLGSVLLSWGIKLYEEYLAPAEYWADIASGRVVQYSSPTMFLAGIALFVIFQNIKPPKALCKIISVIAPCTFGVYILHTQTNVWYKIITYKYAHYVNYPIWQMIGAGICTALAIFAVLWVVDFVRSLVFKILRIKPLLQKAEEKLAGDLWK